MRIDLDKEVLPIMCGYYPRELDKSADLEITLDSAEDFLEQSLPDKVDYGEMVGAEPWSWGSYFVYEDPDPYFYEYAIRCIQELRVLKEMYDGNRLNPTPVAVGDSVWIIQDRQVIERKVLQVRILQDAVLFELDSCDTVDIASISKNWWPTKDKAEEVLSMSELERLGLL